MIRISDIYDFQKAKTQKASVAEYVCHIQLPERLPQISKKPLGLVDSFYEVPANWKMSGGSAVMPLSSISMYGIESISAARCVCVVCVCVNMCKCVCA